MANALTATKIIGILSLGAYGQTFHGLPEPGLVMYGSLTIANGSAPLFGGNVIWQITGSVPSETATIASTVVNVNGEYFYIARVPFETRAVGSATFVKTPGTLQLTPTASAYTRSATVNGTNAAISPPASSTFQFGSADRGRVERVNLSVFLPASAQDADGDGMSDWAEQIAGTDPNDRNSVFKISSDVRPDLQGGIVITWSSVAGKTYSIHRSTNIASSFIQLQANINATAPLNTYRDLSATNTAIYFYRIRTP